MRRTIFNSTIMVAIAAFMLVGVGCYPVCEGPECELGDCPGGSCTVDVDVDVNCGSGECCDTRECPECPECRDCPDCPTCPDCPECPECPECTDCCGCTGQVTWLIMQYTGQDATVAKVKQHDGQTIFHDWLQPGQKFVLFGLANNGKMGPEIDFFVNCEAKCQFPCNLQTSIHTSCSQPIGPGLQSGDFLVVDGESYDFDGPLCDLDNE